MPFGLSLFLQSCIRDKFCFVMLAVKCDLVTVTKIVVPENFAS